MKKLKFSDNTFIYNSREYLISEVQMVLDKYTKTFASRELNISSYLLDQVIDYYGLVVHSENYMPIYYEDRVKFKGDRIIYVDDVINYYINENHSKNECLAYFNISNSEMSYLIKHYNIKKSRQLSLEINRKTKLERYGDANYNNTEKYNQTCLERYGVDNVFKDGKRMKQYYMNKLGVDNPNKLKEVRDKIKETCLEKYGVDSVAKYEPFKEKTRKTFNERYGGNSPMCSETVKAKYNFNKIGEKAFNTKLNNGTTNTSKPQEYLIEKLRGIFGEDDVIQEYKESRYPYHCDAYIKSKDIFIELNLYFTHGGHLFDETNSDDMNKLSIWIERSKTSKFYENAINVWTRLDLEKKQCAIDNKLNYISIYTIDDMDKLIEKLKENKNENQIK